MVEKIGKEKILLGSSIRKEIVRILSGRELTLYELTKKLCRKELEKKRRKWSKNLYEKVRYHLNTLRKHGFVKLSREETVELVKLQKETDIEKEPIIITKKFYTTTRKYRKEFKSGKQPGS